MSQGGQSRVAASRGAVVGYVATAVVLGVILARILMNRVDGGGLPGYASLSYIGTVILIVTMVIGLVIRRIDVTVARWFPWVVGAAALAASTIPHVLVQAKSTWVDPVYQSLHVPKGEFPFWDLLLPLKSIDCTRFGFDVYAANNGCLQDPSIYGPGVIWLRWIPFHPLREDYLTFLGFTMVVISSALLLWLARRSNGLGQIVLLVAAVGGPWLLMLERGNIDACLLWGAGVVVILVSRWNRLWAWWVAAGVIWILGTWKYYPFAMGVMLIPVLRLRRGWTVLVGYAIASIGFVLLTWSNFQFSSQSNSNMVNYDDFVVLGRIPVVARMIGSSIPAAGEPFNGLQFNSLLVYLLALAALGWGIAIGLMSRPVRMHQSMLAIAGGSLFLASVLYGGFGWAYKATFLLLCVPLIAGLTRGRRVLMTTSALTMLAMTVLSSVIVWNTVIASLAGIMAASFAVGVSAVLLVRSVRGSRSTVAA